MNFKISKIFLKAIYVIAGLTAIYLLYIFLIFLPRIEESTVHLENTIGEIQLQKTAQIIKVSADELLTYKEMALQTKKDELKRLTNIAWSIVDSEFKSSNHKTTKEAKKYVLELLNKIEYANNDYFFVSNYQNILISHPYLQNTDFTNVQDIYGNLIVPPMVEIARKEGTGFTSYWWKKNTKNDEIYEKISFVKNFTPWEWVVGTGVYVDDIVKEVDKRKKMLLKKLKKILHTTKIGKSGYVYIFDETGKMIIHPNEKLEGKDGSKLRNPNKDTYILTDLKDAYKNGDKKLHYLWDKPNDIGNYSYEKISWIEYDTHFKWYIVSTGYVEEFYESSNNMKLYIIYSVLFLSMLIIGIGFFFLRAILSPIVKLSEHAKKVRSGRLDVRYTDKITNDETGTLAIQFNQMLDTINTQIQDLDDKVDEKTQALQFALNEKEILLREVQHRVKNNLNVINSIIGLQAFQEKQPSIESFVLTLQQRINSMSLAHELLNKSKNIDSIDVKKYITTLVDSLIEAYDNPSTCACKYEIDEIELEIDKLLSCGLIVNELVTNSIKYAFKESHNYLYLSIKRSSDNTLSLTLKDNGKGFDNTIEYGIGLELVETLVNQLKGSIEFLPKESTTIINFKI